MRKVKAKDKGIAKKLKLEEDDEEEEENEDEDEEMESDDEGKLRNHVDLKGAWFGKMLFSLFPEYSSCFFFTWGQFWPSGIHVTTPNNRYDLAFYWQ